MNDDKPGRRPEQQAENPAQSQPEQQQRQHHDPNPRGGNPGLASQTPKGGASQDGFGQSGDQGTPSQTERNVRPGG